MYQRETSPTPSDFIDDHTYTPSNSLPVSPERFGHVENEDTMMAEMDQRLHQSQMDISLSVGAVNYSSASEEDAEMVALATEPNIHDAANALEVVGASATPVPEEVASTSSNSGGHMQFHESRDLEIETFLANGDLVGLRAHYAKMHAQLSENAHQLQKLESSVESEKARADSEANRAREAEKLVLEATVQAAQAQSAQQPMLVKDGLPIVLASSGLMSPVVSDKENHAPSQGTPQKNMLDVPANGSIAIVTPTRHYMVSPQRSAPIPQQIVNTITTRVTVGATKAAIKRTVLEPLVRTKKMVKSYTSDIREQLSLFQQDFHETSKLILGALISNDEKHGSPGSLMARYQAEKKQRQRLHDQLLELQGNIRVFARVRPIMGNTASNASGGESNALVNSAQSSLLAAPNDAGRLVKEIEQDATRYIDDQTLGHLGKIFDFDRVLHQQSTQEEVYKNVAPFMQSVVDGQNVAIFAYGQTGSGKTYTMDGKPGIPGQEGVNVRALSHLFQLLQSKSDEFEWKVKLQAVEIYNEQPRDLLVDPITYKKSLNTDATKLEIHQTFEGQVYIPGLTEKVVANESEVRDCIEKQIKLNRATAATSMNEYSSRSHSLLFLTVETQSKEHAEEKTHARLVLIDLAGSERVKKSEASGQALKEATSINKSLSALGDVIAALKTKAAHVPFRNSKLTYLLSDVMGGSGKVLMFAQISPSVSDASESACTLQFASRVRAVQLGGSNGVSKAKKASTQQAFNKLLKLESSLQEKDSLVEKVTQEVKAVREELAQEKSQSMIKIAQLQSLQGEKIRVLEQELSKKIQPIVQQQAQQAQEKESAEIAHLAALVRAKDREINELKLSRPAGNFTNPPPRATPRIHTVGSGASSLFSSVSSTLVSPIASSSINHPVQAIQGVNLLDTFSSQATIETDVRVEDIEMIVADVTAQAQEDENGDKENPSLSASQPKRLSGSKRKESTAAATATADENDSENIAPTAEEPQQPVAKKAKILGNASTNVLNTSISNTNAIGAVVKKPAFKAVVSAAPSRQQLTPRATRSKVALAWKNDVSMAVDESMNASVAGESTADLLSTPIPAAGAKTVRFGGAETKFISPIPSPLQPTHQSSLIMPPANLETLRVKSRVGGAGVKSASGMLGGAKRTKTHSVPAWNSSFK